VSAIVVGIGGALYAQLLGSFTPDAFYIALTFLILAMIVVGGFKSLTGVVLGTIFLSAVAEVLRRIEDKVNRPGLQQVGFGVILLGVLILLPSGLSRGREIRIPRRWRPQPGGQDAGLRELAERGRQ